MMSNHESIGNGKILFVVNAPEFFLSHRLPLAVAAREAGYDVSVVTAAGQEATSIRTYGFSHYAVPFVRSGQNPIDELKTLVSLVKLFRFLNPDLVHLVTIKPVLYGGLAARLAGVKSVVAAVSGMGTVFLANSAPARMRRWLVTRFYSVAFKQRRIAVIFQNPDDRDTMISLGVVGASDTRMIRGAGVTLSDYPYLAEPRKGRSVVVMAARLLRDKGVFEFVEAARLLRNRGLSVQMRLLGSPDPGNPTSVTQQDVESWKQEGVVELLGFRRDVAAQYASANIVCLPSYREGLPKSLVEAAACGRAVVTTDVPGCRDAISPDETGLLVPVKNAKALADGIQKLVEDPALRHQMGAAGRKLAEDEFSIEKIVEQHISIYTELLGNE